MLKGANCHRESGRHGQLHTPRPSHSKQISQTCLLQCTLPISARTHRHTQIGPYAYHTCPFSESTPMLDPAESNTMTFSSSDYKPGLFSLQNALCIIL